MASSRAFEFCDSAATPLDNIATFPAAAAAALPMTTATDDKGGGGAMHREKIVELRADKFVPIVDESKLTDKLGPSFPLPVEVTPFCYKSTLRSVAALPACKGCEPRMRLGSAANRTRTVGAAGSRDRNAVKCRCGSGENPTLPLLQIF